MERDQGYLYPHLFPGHWVKQQYLPDILLGTQYYEGDRVSVFIKSILPDRMKIKLLVIDRLPFEESPPAFGPRLSLSSPLSWALGQAAISS